MCSVAHPEDGKKAQQGRRLVSNMENAPHTYHIALLLLTQSTHATDDDAQCSSRYCRRPISSCRSLHEVSKGSPWQNWNWLTFASLNATTSVFWWHKSPGIQEPMRIYFKKGNTASGNREISSFPRSLHKDGATLLCAMSSSCCSLASPSSSLSSSFSGCSCPFHSASSSYRRSWGQTCYSHFANSAIDLRRTLPAFLRCG